MSEARVRTRSPRAERKEVTRARLLQAAGDVIAERGYRGASLDEIALRAGLTKGAVYSNFESKEELFFAVLDSAAVVPDFSMFASTTASLREQLRAFARGLADLATSPELVSQMPLEFEFVLLAIRDDRVMTRARDQQRYVRRSLAAWLELRATESALTLPLPAEQFAAALVGLLRGLLQQRVFEPEVVTADVFADAVSLLLGLPADPATGGAK